MYATTRYPMINPEVPEDFSKMWTVNVTEKTVLDIGADRGSTASFFLNRGASIVIAVEGNPNLFNELKQNAVILANCIPVFKYIQSGADMEHLLAYPADVVKIDVEGAEKYLLDINPAIILQHPSYMIELHRIVDTIAIKNRFKQLEYKVTHVAAGWPIWEIIHCTRIPDSFNPASALSYS